MIEDNATRLHIEPFGVKLIAEDGQEILVSEPMLAGRSKDGGLVIDDDQISRRHAQLNPLSDGLEVEDLGSSNGTFLNGQRLPKFIARNGDVINFYVHKFTVQIAVTAAEPAFDPDATRLHMPDSTLPLAASAAPDNLQVKTPSEDVVPTLDPPPENAVVGSVEPAPGQTAPTAQPVADKQERAWWETSDEGPVGTLLLKPGELDMDAEMTRLFNLGAAQQPRLVGLAGEYAGKCYELGEGKFIIGREQACDVRLDNDGISVKHAQIIHEGGTWKLVNLLSSNGTFVNGERIQTAYLNSGDELRFGPVGLMFQLPGGALAKSASVGAPVPQPAKPGAGKAGLIAAVAGFVLVLVIGAIVLL